MPNLMVHLLVKTQEDKNRPSIKPSEHCSPDWRCHCNSKINEDTETRLEQGHACLLITHFGHNTTLLPARLPVGSEFSNNHFLFKHTLLPLANVILRHKTLLHL
eukprot:jgi/Psemu1/29702/gm1.29702_g